MNRSHPVGALCLAFFFSAPVYAQNRPIIVIDAAHGGADAGAYATATLPEKDVVLAAAYVLGEQLIRAGYDIRLTRTGDYLVQYDQRTGVATDAAAAALISLHVNSSLDPSRAGVQLFVPEGRDADSDRLGFLVETAITAMNRPVTRASSNFALFRATNVPSIIVEMGYASHSSDRALVTDPGYQAALARQIVSAIEEFAPHPE